MALETSISWCTATWNPWQGCSKVSAECANCYMFRDKARYGQDPASVVRSSPSTFAMPLARHSARSKHGEPGTYKLPAGSRVFTCSWSDWFHEAADPWRMEAWEIVRQRPDVNFLILTKRPERILEHLPPDWGEGWLNVWLGVTCGTQASVWRVDALSKVPATIRFVSVEPLLGWINFGPSLGAIHWMITGGESGPKARPMSPEWALHALRQGYRAGCLLHHKQNGEYAPLVALSNSTRRLMDESEPGRFPEAMMDDRHLVYRVGLARAGRVLHGRTFDDVPHGVASPKGVTP